MNSELETYLDQLLSITQDVPGLIGKLSHEQFNWRPAPERWSIAECFDHLNASARAFVPAMDAAIADARARRLESQGPFTYPLIERVFVRVNEPPPKLTFRAPRALKPSPGKEVDLVLGEFMNWQTALGERIRRADGIDLRRARHKSPVGPLKWSLGTMFAVVLAHERRHTWQARQVRREIGFPV
jgi:hypothetical protein